jgi:hypothetical protein
VSFGTMKMCFLWIFLTGDTVTAEGYCGTLERLWQAVYHKRPGLLCQGIILHNNARPHTDNQTGDWLQRSGWEVVDHPPYSLSLTLLISISFDSLRSTWMASGSQQTVMCSKPPVRRCLTPVSSMCGTSLRFHSGTHA